MEEENEQVDPSNICHRVKVYTLSCDKWVDRGTGYCSGLFEPEPHFHVINEADSKDILLDCPIKGTTQYQRQQDTLIVWTNNDDGTDYALSFQESEGCLQICEFLIKVQREGIEPNISLVAIIQSGDGEISEVVAGPILELPDVKIGQLKDVLDVLTMAQFRNRVMTQINSDWLRELCRVFQKCEKEKLLSDIYCLTDIVKTLVFANEIDFFEMFIQEGILNNIIGILEYEPEYPGLKMNWREYYEGNVREKVVVKVEDVNISKTIREISELKFLRDVVLTKLIDDCGYGCISMMIQDRECKALESLMKEERFFDDYLQMYNDNQSDLKLKNDGIKLLNQLVNMSKSLQGHQRSDFFKLLITKAIKLLIDPGDSTIIDESFYEVFYDNRAYAYKLFTPLLRVVRDIKYLQECTQKRSYMLKLEHNVELLSHIARIHDSDYSRSFIIDNNLLYGVDSLIGQSSLKMQTRLSGVRCMRHIVMLNNPHYMRHIQDKELLRSALKLLVETTERGENTLVSAACLALSECLPSNFKVAKNTLRGSAENKRGNQSVGLGATLKRGLGDVDDVDDVVDCGGFNSSDADHANEHDLNGGRNIQRNNKCNNGGGNMGEPDKRPRV
ncbi:Serine/threonine-protein phosphatase 4 regulatory subunit 3 [Pichia kudriavzevii]|uniref:Serine/threonine-protein phosphatase 4 regulatory subunit 3 n=1 Tax=Pichia kudriavzevii TaxID=4909 RepID=A0A1V2LMU7_PICKU|nr:Serine/threonine-protein phosphatase 4 regulatory subunit 3 [Pichia kudriavzevii]